MTTDTSSVASHSDGPSPVNQLLAKLQQIKREGKRRKPTAGAFGLCKIERARRQQARLAAAKAEVGG